MKVDCVIILCVSVLIQLGGAVAQDVKPREAGPPVRSLEQLNDPYLPTPPQPPLRFIMGGEPVTRGPFVSYQVNVDAFGNNIIGDAANEPSIAINPTNPDTIVIGWRQFDNVNSDFRQAGNAHSFDGGVTWTNPAVLTPGVFRSDPVLDSDNDGNIYYYSLKSDLLCDMFKSSDGGMSWVGPTPAFGGDKPWFTVDKTGGVGEGNIYVSWSTSSNPFFPNQLTRSVDGGFVWLGPVEIPPERPSLGTLTVDPPGDLYVSGMGQIDLWVAKSTNAKFAAQSPTFDFTVAVDLGGLLRGFEGYGSPNPLGLLGQMWVASDHSGGPTDGNIYVLATVGVSGSDPEDAMFARSEDGGQTWSPPVRVNDDSPQTLAWQWFGTISVAPTGRIDAVWNDTRNTNQANLSELYYAYSLDAGETWSLNMPASPVFDSHVGWPNQDKIGDYYDMISDNAAANLAYAATFNNEQDVYFLRLGDCNNNGIHDGLELQAGAPDANGDGVLDECADGACCFKGGTCSDSFEYECSTAGGSWHVGEPCLSITTHPISQSVFEDYPVTFSVVAEGVAPFTYQWRHDGVDIAGATQSSYTIASATPVDAGLYDVVVNDTCGQVTSNAATLTVYANGDFTLLWHSVDGGGETLHSGGDFELGGTSAQHDAGLHSGGPFTLTGGFWSLQVCAPLGDCPADLNGDGWVDSADLAILLGSWGLCKCCSADFNRDGIVDSADLSLLLGSWGQCP